MGEYEILDTDEPLAKRVERHAFDRLIMLSDGVFAIAITLLALEIKPPRGLPPGGAGILSALAPSLSGFSVSFLVVAMYWAAHRRMFARLRRVDTWTTVFTLLMLSLVVLQPLALELVIAYGAVGEALAAYLGLIVAIGTAQSALWAYVAFVARLVDPALSTGYRATQLIGGFVTPIAVCGLSLYGSSHQTGATPWLVAIGAVAIVIARRYAMKRFSH